MEGKVLNRKKKRLNERLMSYNKRNQKNENVGDLADFPISNTSNGVEIRLKHISRSNTFAPNHSISNSSSSDSDSDNNFDDDFTKHLGKVPSNYVSLYDESLQEHRSDYACKVCQEGYHSFDTCLLNKINEEEETKIVENIDKQEALKFPLKKASKEYEVLSYDSAKVVLSDTSSCLSWNINDVNNTKAKRNNNENFVISEFEVEDEEKTTKKKFGVQCPRCGDGHKLKDCKTVIKEIPKEIILIPEEEYNKRFYSDYKY